MNGAVSTEEEKRVADQNWRELQQKLNWYPWHFRCVKKLKVYALVLLT